MKKQQTSDRNDDLWHKLNAETAKLQWQELQRHYASGMVVSVASSLDLVDTAYAFARDDKAQVQAWIEDEQVQSVPDEIARAWTESDPVLWGVVVSPFVLVQEEKS